MKSSPSIVTTILLLIMASSSVIASSSNTDNSEQDNNPHVDLCSNDDQCLNGGSCQEANSVIPHRHCLCTSGFSGPACERFCPLDCKNEGYCHVAPTGGASGLLIDQGRVFDPEDYSCKCVGYFTGVLCEIPYKRCGDSERCYNDGECVLGEDMRHRCNCKHGYSGDSCEIRTLTDDDSTMEGILLAMVILLSVVLVYLLKRKRPNQTPDFVQVQRAALKHKMAAMPHASFDDESSSVSVIDFVRTTIKRASLFEEDEDETYASRRDGSYYDDGSTSTDDSSRHGGIHII